MRSKDQLTGTGEFYQGRLKQERTRASSVFDGAVTLFALVLNSERNIDTQFSCAGVYVVAPLLRVCKGPVDALPMIGGGGSDSCSRALRAVVLVALCLSSREQLFRSVS